MTANGGGRMYEKIEINSLGETLLVQTLSSAYYALTFHPVRKGSRVREGSANLNFIQQESGIHKIISAFGLSLNPDTLQQTFFYYVHMA